MYDLVLGTMEHRSCIGRGLTRPTELSEKQIWIPKLQMLTNAEGYTPLHLAAVEGGEARCNMTGFPGVSSYKDVVSLL